jgi:hypothetical protein
MGEIMTNKPDHQQVMNLLEKVQSAVKRRKGEKPYNYEVMQAGLKAGIKLDNLIFKPLMAEAMAAFEACTDQTMPFRIMYFTSLKKEEHDAFADAFEESLYIRYERVALKTQNIEVDFTLPLIGSESSYIIFRRNEG